MCFCNKEEALNRISNVFSQVTGEKTLVTPVLAGEEKCLPLHNFGPHIRDYYLIHYCISGKGTFYKDGKAYPVSQGEIFIITKGEVTTYTADEKDPWHYSWIGFDGEGACRISELPPVIKYPHDTFLRVAEYARISEIAPEIYLSLIYEILYHLVSVKKDSYDVTKRIKDHIRLNYMEEMSVESIAENVGMNRRYLSRLFKERYGISIKEYIVTVRCHRAADFLKQGYTVSEAAYMSGYTDAFAFSKIFRKVMGMSPTEYKKEKNGVDN